MTADAEWRGTVGNRRIGEPFKPGPNPMLTIPGLERDSILPDSCHCCHLGWGIDFAASGLVLLCKRMYFNNGTLNQTLHYAYKKFLKWCDANGKTTGIDWWSVKKLDMKTSLELSFSLPRFSVLLYTSKKGFLFVQPLKHVSVTCSPLGTMIGQHHWGVVPKPMILHWSCNGWKRAPWPKSLWFV